MSLRSLGGWHMTESKRKILIVGDKAAHSPSAVGPTCAL